MKNSFLNGLKLYSFAALMLALAGPSVAAQTTPPQTPPAGQKPAAPATAPAQPAAPAAPVPFPEGAKVAYIYMQGIFNGSADGKAAAARVEAWDNKKAAEIQAKVKEGEALQAKVNQSATVLTDTARAQAQRDLQRLEREIKAMQEDAQQEAAQMRQQILAEFSKKVNPIIAAVAKEHGLHMVFTVSEQSNLAWAEPGLDLTQEVIKRVDAASTAPKK